MRIYSSPSWRIHNMGSSRGRWPKPKKRNWSTRKAVSIFIFLITVSLLGAGVGGSFFLWYFSRGLPQPGQIIERSLAQSTKIYDRTGAHLLFDVHGEVKRTAVKLSDIPTHAKNAAIVAEDKNFYSHGGFDLRGIVRALFVNILRRGKVQGGSTITQQFIKNAVLSPEKTYTRKFRELVMAYKIEKDFSKDQILEMYFNEIPYGSTSYGVEAASQTFFGKSVRDLNLAEAAFVAAVPKAPTYYSPYGSHQDELVARQHHILDQMVKEKYIDENAALEAKKEDVLWRIKPKRENIVAPHFVMYIRELLAERYGERAVEQGGLTVVTSLDVEKQKLAEKAIADNKALINSFGASNAALVALDAHTGHILAMVGSLDYFDEKIDGNVNVALRPRQPGSSFKPVVYAASFIKGYTPTTVLYDVNTVFKTEIGKDYEPKNYDGKEHGPVTVRQALAGSLNLPAVKMIYLTGVSRVLDLAEKMGYTTLHDRSRFGLSLVLGGGEVKLLEHAAAFGSFAREGKLLSPVPLLKIADSSGKILEEWKEVSEIRAFDVEVARQISSILSDNGARSFIFGSENYLTLPDRPVAAKTGTTNDFRDAWTIGYTPSLVAGVWVGNNNNSVMKKDADGSRIAAPIWNQFMREALKDSPPLGFTEPAAVVTGKPVLDGQVEPGVAVKIDTVSGKRATEYTPTQTTVLKNYRQTHDILFFVNKDDPRGVNPSDPSSDIQFASWEDGARRFAEARGFVDEIPPQDFDDVHRAEDRPVLAFISPVDNASVGLSFTTSLSISARRDIKKVEFYVDDVLIETVFASPWNMDLSLPTTINNGFKSLRAVAYDDLFNNDSAEIIINVVR